MNVDNIALHQWIITTKHGIFHKYIQFDDKHLFDPIILSCALGQDRNATFPDDLAGKLTAIVTYKTRYVYENYKSVNLSFGLFRDVAVNAIIGKPTLKTWRCIVKSDSDYLISIQIHTKFPMTYKIVNSGMPPSIKFDIK